MIHNIQQSSNEWHEFRSKHFGASEAPIAAGVSKYTSRTDLLKQKHSGVEKEIDERTQALFNKGHVAEANARVIAERIICEDLSPLVMSKEIDGLPLSASLDGCTFSNKIIWENKLYSESLAKQIRSGDIEPHYTFQLAQQVLVSGAEKVLFMASDGTEENTVYCWYTPTQEDMDRVIDVWKQFKTDLINFQHVEEKSAPIAEAIIALPSLSVQIKGEVTTSNLPVFVSAADKFLAGIKTELETDQDFANAEANVKACKAAEDGIEKTKKDITAQAVSIDEVMRTMDLYKEKLANVRLKLDKLVKTEKEARKTSLVSKAGNQYTDHVAALQAEISGIRLSLLITSPDFGAAIKGLKSLSSMQDALDTALANGKIAADTAAKDIRDKLAWCKENAAGHSALFPDLQQLVSKPIEDFTLTISTRIKEFHEREQAKLEAERARIQAEEEAKARAKVEEEQRAASTKVSEVVSHKAEAMLAPENEQAASVSGFSKKLPTRSDIISLVAYTYEMSIPAAHALLRAEFEKVAA